MNKKHLHHTITRLRLIKLRYLLMLVLLGCLVSIISLRANNEQMLKLRNAVYSADKSGGDVQKPLQTLQAYVTRHMNTNLSTGNTSVYPPIQLEYTYERLAQAESTQASGTNTQLYTDAQNYCQSTDPTDFSGHNRVPCIEQYVENHSSVSQPQVPSSLYEFDFISPSWSPDLAGWSIVTTILLAVIYLVTLTCKLYFKYEV